MSRRSSTNGCRASRRRVPRRGARRCSSTTATGTTGPRTRGNCWRVWCEPRDAGRATSVKPFADHFSRIAASYAAYRPHYPEELFSWLASVAPTRDRAWDCGTGNGQAAAALSRQFAHVVATDPTAAQIASAKREPGISYAVMTAERPAIASRAVALVTVAQ